jgi:hypothetical protein
LVSASVFSMENLPYAPVAFSSLGHRCDMLQTV